MRLSDLKYDLFSLSEYQQTIVFGEYYDKREKDLRQPIKTTVVLKRKSKGKQLTLSTEQLELLKKMKLI